MNTQKLSKINRLLCRQPAGTALAVAWLTQEGYSPELLKQYRKSGWFDSIGTGAIVRHGDEVDYLGGVYALQTQLGLSVHPAAKTALALQGKLHYLSLSAKSVQLFAAPGDTPPLWFKKRDWGVKVSTQLTSFLPAALGLVDINHKNFSVKVSSPARAIMECLYLAPNTQPLLEVYELMDGLNNLRPTSVQQLMEACTSIKVKRLFLYLAEKAGHQWLSYLDLERIDLGSGKRAIVKGGSYVPKYQITVPKELEVTE
ncbi:MAG: hypothetical protein ACJA1T_000953 [Zhongshania aliphaticivorans]|jgi:hypothetical protein